MAHQTTAANVGGSPGSTASPLFRNNDAISAPTPPITTKSRTIRRTNLPRAQAAQAQTVLALAFSKIWDPARWLEQLFNEPPGNPRRVNGRHWPGRIATQRAVAFGFPAVVDRHHMPRRFCDRAPICRADRFQGLLARDALSRSSREKVNRDAQLGASGQEPPL